MKIGIMQPYIFPYIGYFQLINAVDKFILFDDVNYIKKGWINRNRILINGKDFTFNIPLENVSQNKLIKDISIVADPAWKLKFLKTIEMAYCKAPFYQEIYPIVKKLIEYDEQSLSSFLYNTIQEVCAYLSINTEILPSSEPYNTQSLKAQDKIIKICQTENASVYINPIGGVELYDKALFQKQGLVLQFIKTSSSIYTQFNNPFIPFLSILDVMMFNSVEKIHDMLGQFELV